MKTCTTTDGRRDWIVPVRRFFCPIAVGVRAPLSQRLVYNGGDSSASRRLDCEISEGGVS